MQKWINKKVSIIAEIDGNRLVYTAKVLDVSETHLTITDKFGKTLSLRKDHIIIIQEDNRE